MATKKAGGSSKNGRDSNPQYRGIKCSGGQVVPGGSVIVRQCGTQFHPGMFVGLGKDHTIFAKVSGRVVFERKGKPMRRYVSIIPMEEVAVVAASA